MSGKNLLLGKLYHPKGELIVFLLVKILLGSSSKTEVPFIFFFNMYLKNRSWCCNCGRDRNLLVGVEDYQIKCWMPI